MPVLEESYFVHSNALQAAEALIGARLHRKVDGQEIIVEITETEAYLDQDRACHAFDNKRTPRTEIMFHPRGKIYTYLIYGIHTLFNITCNGEVIPLAVLIRSAKILQGETAVRRARKNNKKSSQTLLRGPGNFAQGLSFSLKDYGFSICQKDLFIEATDTLHRSKVLKTKRIGVNYAGQDALLPYRFYAENEASVSKG